MEYHPLPTEQKNISLTTKDVVAESPAATATAEPFRVVSFPSLRWVWRSAAGFALVLLVAVPILAERAVPGDALYAVKVQVNEELRSTLTFNSYQKVEWETERLNRRIAEARLLASEGKLTEEVEATVAEAVREHTETVHKEIEALRVVDADEATIASIALDTTLEAQSTSLRGGGTDEVLAEGAEIMLRPTDMLADAIDASRAQAESMSTTSLPAYVKLMARVEQNTTRVYELRNSLEGVVTEEKLTEMDRRIADIERTIAVAIELATTSEQEAKEELVDALQRTQKLIVYLTELDVKETVDIESLVPVVLTEEEVELLRMEALDTIDRSVEATEVALLEVEDEQVVEKVTFALDELALLHAQIASTALDRVTFRPLVIDATALIADTVQLLEQQGVMVEVQPPTSGETSETGDFESATATSSEEVASSTDETITDEAASSSEEVLPEGETASSSDGILESEGAVSSDVVNIAESDTSSDRESLDESEETQVVVDN